MAGLSESKNCTTPLLSIIGHEECDGLTGECSSVPHECSVCGGASHTATGDAVFATIVSFMFKSVIDV